MNTRKWMRVGGRMDGEIGRCLRRRLRWVRVRGRNGIFSLKDLSIIRCFRLGGSDLIGLLKDKPKRR